MEKTAWFPADVKPARVGIYERLFADSVQFSRWNGTFWFYKNNTIESADMEVCLSWNLLPWRGLASDPKGKK